MKILPNHRVRLRELANLSLRGLADHTGVSQTRLNLWERGETELHTSEIRTFRNVILELSGRNHAEVSRLLNVEVPKMNSQKVRNSNAPHNTKGHYPRRTKLARKVGRVFSRFGKVGLSTRTLHRFARNGRLRAVLCGRRRVIPVSALKDLLTLFRP